MPARVLVVEDDPVVHQMVIHVVKQAGHDTVSAHTGEEALGILQEAREPIDCLISDIRLPGAIDGWIVGSEFVLSRPLQPVVYMSAVEEDLTSRRASNSVFLKKPITVARLTEVVEGLVSGGGPSEDQRGHADGRRSEALAAGSEDAS
jgi:CheY-like chemotaxis protein